MKYISTRGGTKPVDFETAVMTGLAADGGLYLPETIPDVRPLLARWENLSYNDLAFEIMRLYCGIPERDLREIIRRSYAPFPGDCPVRIERAGDYFLLELFHGPTLAFKDIALQFLGNLFEYFLARSGSRLNLVAATSGDTGSAAIAGVRGRSGIRIFVLYPHNRVSRAQERQMTTVPDSNVYCIAVKGSFDDCQNIVKRLLADPDLRRELSLGAVNSINWARILAQAVYYFYAALRVRRMTGARRVQFAVPTGNFGDIFAGYLARRMGLPVARLVLASNQNRILPVFFSTGVYRRGRVCRTLSPSMDIQVASNFERYLFYRAGGPAAVRRLMKRFGRRGSFRLSATDRFFCAGSAGDAGTIATIRDFQREYGYVLDPHTAVGVRVAARFMECSEPMVCLATAHPAKFSGAVRAALGWVVSHPVIDDVMHRKTRRFVMPVDEDKIRRFIIGHASEK